MKRERALVLLLALGAIALRLYAARDMAYWDDDLGTMSQAHRIDSLAELLRATNDWHPPLGFLFAKIFLGLAPHELAFRAPFIVAGSLAVPLGWLVARRLLERPSALAVAFALAVHPLLVWSDRDIRGYALLEPLTLAAALFWLRAHDTRAPRDWALVALFLALACWTHYNAIPFTAALLAWSFFAGERRAAVLVGLAVLALFAPWLPAMREHLGIDFAKHAKNVQLAIPPVPVTAPCYVLFGMILGYTVFPWNLVVTAPAALASAYLAARGFVERRALLLGLVLPIVGAAATPFKMPRYYVASVPFLLVLLARGVERTKHGPRIFAVVIAALIFSDVELLRGREHHFLFPLHPWRAAEAVVRARPAPVVAPPGPFRWFYVPDLAAAPVGSACWLLVDEKTSEADEARERAALEAEGFAAREDVPLLRDEDHEARARWVHRGTRDPVVRLVRFERR